MIRILTFTVLATCCWSSPAAAAAEGPATCASILEDASRLACFDAYFSPVTDEPATGANTVVEQLVKADLEEGVVAKRIGYEEAVTNQFFALSPHRLNYVLPVSYNADSDFSPYGAFGDRFSDTEVKFQVSIKALLADNLWKDSSVWIGYTQQAWWQLYAEEEASAPFRETNYQPEIFWSVPTDFELFGWRARTVNLALNHQSNGRSEPLSRSWNRIKGGITFDRGPFAANIETWYRLPEEAENDNNPDILEYMGRAQLNLAYKRGDQLFALGIKNNLSSNNRSGVELNWTFPLVEHLRGFVQIYSGYGESMIDAENYTNRIGIGVSLSDWL
jgi:phospholipase A1